MKVIVVGGVAGGMSAAARLRRLREDAEIVVLERGEYVSFANCGLPYHLAGEIVDRERLLVQTPASLAAALDLDVRTRHEVTAIDRDARQVSVSTPDGEQRLPYDVLLLAPGAKAIVPPLPGLDHPAVRTLRTVPDVDALKAVVDAGARSAVVVGAGFIGLEAAEALRHRGLAVTLVELADQVLAPLDPEMAAPVEAELRARGVDVRLGAAMTGVRVTGRASALEVDLTTGDPAPADLVLLAIGVRPETTLATDAGLDVDDRGAIVVDEHGVTSDTAIYAVGDAVAVRHRVTGATGPVPLAGPANRHGRAAADLVLLAIGVWPETTLAPVSGTAIVRVFDVVAASTGLSEKALRAAGIAHHAVHLHPHQHAGYYPGATQVHLKLLFAPDGRVLGAQATGADGVDKRIDVLATALHAGLTVWDLAELDLAYAPPFGSAKDPVTMAGYLAGNVLAGQVRLWYPADLDDAAVVPADAVLLDVRSDAEAESGRLPGALVVPHTQLRERLAEVPRGVPVRVYCASGLRSYLASRVLLQEGWDDVRTLSGGLLTLRAARPGLVLEAPVSAG
ncbi:MAG: FAD-dependent oxidoreductase [Kineosporiaceae bacterium]